MKTISYSPKRRNRAESLSIFVVCFLAVAILGGVGAYFAKVFQSSYVAPFAPHWVISSLAWLTAYALLGTALYFAITSDILTRVRHIVRGWILALWVTLFVLSVLAPFLIYAYPGYLAAFVLLALTASISAAAIVLFLRIRIAGALALIPYTAWIIFMSVVSIYAALI